MVVSGLIRASWAGTALFGAASVVAVVDDGTMRTAAVIVDLALFAAGCGAFLWAFALAVGRSRHEAIGVGGLYFLAGCAPQGVRRYLMGALAVQVVVAFTAASLRPFTAVAFAILVPMFGLGLAGLWAARHGMFDPR